MGTRPRSRRVTEAVGAEVIELVDGKIKEVLDYQSPTVGQGRVATSQARRVSGRHQRTDGFRMTQWATPTNFAT
jgi:hypothetical protein